MIFGACRYESNRRSPYLVAPVAIIMLICAASFGCRQEKAEAPPATPPTVLAAEVVQERVPIYSQWLGTTEGLVNATIRAQVTGYLVKQAYQEGSYVKSGQVLFEIDPRPFQAAAAQARGELARTRARHATAKANLERIIPLAQANAVSQKDRDRALGEEQASSADIQAAEAALRKAELDLAFTRITSPIDGVAGLAQAQVGDLVGPNQTSELTTVSKLDPIKVYLPLSEQQYLQAARARENGERPKTPLELYLADGSKYPAEGTFSFADRQVDPRTGTIRVAALFPNPNRLLRPGLYARVRAATSTMENALLVPQRAVTELQGTYRVAVVKPDETVEMRSVKVGPKIGQQWVIEEGLQPGERVVAEGMQKVKQGVRVAAAPFESSTASGTSSPASGSVPGGGGKGAGEVSGPGAANGKKR